MPMQLSVKNDEGKTRSEGSARKIISTRELMGDAREVIIEHGGEHYRLRITSNQKLILTK